jgi:hypothetical protein
MIDDPAPPGDANPTSGTTVNTTHKTATLGAPSPLCPRAILRPRRPALQTSIIRMEGSTRTQSPRHRSSLPHGRGTFLTPGAPELALSRGAFWRKSGLRRGWAVTGCPTSRGPWDSAARNRVWRTRWPRLPQPHRSLARRIAATWKLGEHSRALAHASRSVLDADECEIRGPSQGTELYAHTGRNAHS